MSKHGMSERRAYQVRCVARSTPRHWPAARDDSGAITFIQAHMELNSHHDCSSSSTSDWLRNSRGLLFRESCYFFFVTL